MTLNKLFVRKLLVAFIVGFAGSFISFVTGAGQAPMYGFEKSAWVALLVGAVIGGARAVLVLLPGVNLVPSDSQSPLSKTPAKPPV